MTNTQCISRDEWDRFNLPELSYDSYWYAQWLCESDVGPTLRCLSSLIYVSTEALCAEEIFNTGRIRIHVLCSVYFDWITESLQNLLFCEGIVINLHSRIKKGHYNTLTKFYNLWPDLGHMTELPDTGLSGPSEYDSTAHGGWSTAPRPYWSNAPRGRRRR